MQIWEIDAQMQALFDQADPDTGELPEDAVEALEALQLERETKLEGWALSVKNDLAEVAAIEEAEKTLAKRKKAAKNRAERKKARLAELLDGEKLKTGRVSAYWRRSTSIVLDEGKTWEDFDERFLKHKDPEISLSAIREAIEAGEDVPGAHLQENNNLILR